MAYFSPQHRVMLIIIVGSLLRLLLAGTIGLGVDESYVVSIARVFSLSYFDHPPLHFWIIWLTTHLFNSENAIVLRLPFILLFAGTTWMMYCLGAKLFGEWAGVYAALILNISAVFSLSTGSWILPDGPLMFLLLAAALVLVNLFFSSNSQASLMLWITAGLLAGLGMLAKYHAVFLVLGSFTFMLTSKQYRSQLLTAGPYLAVTAAAVVFLPVIIWNQEHDWISFVFQGNRGIAHGFFPIKMLSNIAGQAAWALPWIWLPLVWVLIKRLVAGPDQSMRSSLQARQWFLCCLAIGPIAVFTMATLWGAQGLFHWQAPGYLFALPLLGHTIAGRMERGSRVVHSWLAASTAAFLIIVAILGSHTATGWMRQLAPPWFAQGDPTDEALDWRDLPIYLKQKGLLNSQVQGIIAAHWIDASKIDYALGGKLPVLCLSNEPHHFAFMHNQAELKGSDVLIIGRKPLLEATLPAFRPYFSAIEPIGTVEIKRYGLPEFEVTVFYAKSFNAVFPLPYGQFN